MGKAPLLGGRSSARWLIAASLGVAIWSQFEVREFPLRLHLQLEII